MFTLRDYQAAAVSTFRRNVDASTLRRGAFDGDIRKSGSDPAFCHRILS